MLKCWFNNNFEYKLINVIREPYNEAKSVSDHTLSHTQKHPLKAMLTIMHSEDPIAKGNNPCFLKQSRTITHVHVIHRMRILNRSLFSYINTNNSSDNMNPFGNLIILC